MFNISVKLMDGSIIFPFHKVVKRIENGNEDSLYFYGLALEKI